jgi:putative membrane protein
VPLGLLFDVRARPTVPYELSWSIHPSVVIGTGLLGALYFWGIGPARRRFGWGPPPPAWKVTSFVASLVVVLVSLNGPMHDLSDYYLFSIHMAQHLLLTLLWPPLLIAGLPGWLIDGPLARAPGLARAGRAITHPLVAGVVYTASIALWHVVTLYDLMMRVHEVHVFTHLMFMVTAVIMWWPALSPSTLVPPLGLGARMLYLFLVSIPMQLLAAIITFADDPLYLWYVEAPRTWNLSPLDDQKLGGLLMWIPGNLWMLGAIAILFFVWARREG